MALQKASVRKGDSKNAVVITEPLSPEAAREWIIDTSAHVVTGMRMVELPYKVLWEEKRIEKRRKNRRWILRSEVVDYVGGSPLIVDSYEWQTGPESVTHLDLWKPLAP